MARKRGPCTVPVKNLRSTRDYG